MVMMKERALLWRVKHAKRMGEDANRCFSSAGHLVVMRRRDALGMLGPVILEVLFRENPLSQLVSALKETNIETVN